MQGVSVMGALESAVREVMDAFDRQEYDVLRESLAPDAQGVDEISRRWLRDAGEIDAYFKQLEGVATGISSEMSELREEDWGDVGLVTGWLEQDYTLAGEPQHVSAPITFVLRKVDGDWRIALIHAVPLPADD